MEQQNLKENNNVVVNYNMASVGKRVLATLVDFACSIGTSLVFVGIFVAIANNVPAYNNLFDTRQVILAESQLYVLNSDNRLERISTINDDNQELTYNEKSSYINERLIYFFNNDLYFDGDEGMEIYNEYRAKALTSDNLVLFNEDYSRKLSNSDYDDDYYVFYQDCVETLAVSYLFKNVTYQSIANKIFLIDTVGLVVAALLPLFIFFLIIPLCLKRGRQTIGRKLFNIGLVSYDGLNVKKGRYIGEFFFFFFVEVLLSLVSFLIPFMVSVGFMFISKTHQSLHDYIFMTYEVDVSQDDIYINIDESKRAKKLRENAKIENKDFMLK